MNSNSETKWNSSKRCQLRLPHETEHGLASYLSHPNQGKPDEFRDEIVKKKKTSIYPISQQVCMWINIQKKGYACDSQHQMIILWVNLESWILIKLREMQRAFASISSSYAHSSTKVVNSNMDTIIMKLVLSWHRLCEFYFFTPLFKTFCLCLTGHYTKNHLLPALYRKLRKNISLKPANHYGCFHQIMQLLMVASTLV